MTLRHHHLGAPSCADEDVKFVHERFHQEHAAAGIAKHVFIFPWVRHVLKLESGSLVGYVYHQLFMVQFKYNMNFSFATLFIAVLKSVHHALMHSKTDLVLVILIETGSPCHSNCDFFCESDALDQSLQHNFDPMRF